MLSGSSAPASPSKKQGEAERQQALAQMVVAPTLDPLTRDVLFSDLGQFPTPWLQFLNRYGVKVAALTEGETLADSPFVAKHAVTDLPAQVDSVRSTLAQAFAQVPPAQDELEAHHVRQQLGDNLHQWLGEGPFRLAVHRQPLSLQELADHRQIPAEHRQAWTESLRDLNQPWISVHEGKLSSSHGLFLLPPVPTEHGPIPDRLFQEMVATTSESVAASLGLHRGSEQLVLLHERYLGADAPELGQYRVSIHEVGHALDYALEGLPSETGFGTHHKQRLQEWFSSAQNFTSDRAKDNPREFFAEGVEAYLTAPSQGFDFRPGNHRENLMRTNPELGAYLEKIFGSIPSQTWVSTPPKPQGLPPGFPDPDKDPIYFN